MIVKDKNNFLYTKWEFDRPDIVRIYGKSDKV